MKFQRESRNKWTSAVIDLTPLIDIVFLLLLFFLLTAAPPPDPTLDVALPSASAPGVSSGQQEITVVLESEGAIFLENGQVTLVQLQAKFTELAQNNPGTRVVLRGDRAARYEAFVGVLEAAANANLSLHVAVEEPAGPAKTP